MRKLLFALGLTLIATSAVAKPLYPPREGEYYPRTYKEMKASPSNPWGVQVVLPYRGEAIDLFLHNDMVTQVQLPSPPVLVNLGRAESFSLEVVPELNSLFLKPGDAIAQTNMIVHTDRGVYTFMLKSNPFKPFHSRMVVTDPYKQISPTDEEVLVKMALRGVAPPEFQFRPIGFMENNETHTIKIEGKPLVGLTLKRTAILSRDNRVAYWLTLTNLDKESWAVSEQSLTSPGLKAVAVCGGKENPTFLHKGDKTDWVIITDLVSKNLPLSFDLVSQKGSVHCSLTFSLKGKVMQQPLAKPLDLREQYLKSYKGRTAQSWAEEMRRLKEESERKEQPAAPAPTPTEVVEIDPSSGHAPSVEQLMKPYDNELIEKLPTSPKGGN